jgi:uncharacterized membrane protein YhaH (DUF805 family)
MATANPYDPPLAAVGDVVEEEYQPVKTFSASGRIGRARYVGYTVGWTLLVAALAGVLMTLTVTTGLAALGFLPAMGAYALLIAIQLLLTIQRCHDFNVSGWLCLLLLIPPLNLVFWFMPGTSGPNRFGPPPPPNGTGVIVLALILPIIFFMGIAAVIAFPAYQTYVMHGRASQQH